MMEQNINDTNNESDVPTYDNTAETSYSDPQSSQIVEKPEHVPTKFWDEQNNRIKVDELLTSYTNLEQFLGASKRVKDSEKINRSPIKDSQNGDDFNHVAQPNKERSEKKSTPPALDFLKANPEAYTKLEKAEFSAQQMEVFNDITSEILPAVKQACYQEIVQSAGIAQLEKEYGKQWPTLRKQLDLWAQKTFPKSAYESMVSTPEGVRTLHKLYQSNAGEAMIRQSHGQMAPITKQALKRMMRNPKYWRDRDPDFIARVTNGFRALYDN